MFETKLLIHVYTQTGHLNVAKQKKNSVTTSGEKGEYIKYVLSKSLKLCLQQFL